MPAEATVTVELDRYERGAVLKSLADERNDLIREGRPTDTLDDAIRKVAAARPKHRRLLGGRDEAR
ncbi:MAG: hypothetical protein LBH64_00270 [Coriobacteriales bacterium]|jgi:hypothetical protein|nr:hypothetical protein [Coriobacteriales bacterium]